MSANTKFVINRLPDLPNVDGLYNIKIDEQDYIVDKEHLLKMKLEIEKNLQ